MKYVAINQSFRTCVYVCTSNDIYIYIRMCMCLHCGLQRRVTLDFLSACYGLHITVQRCRSTQGYRNILSGQTRMPQPNLAAGKRPLLNGAPLRENDVHPSQLCHVAHFLLQFSAILPHSSGIYNIYTARTQLRRPN